MTAVPHVPVRPGRNRPQDDSASDEPATQPKRRKWAAALGVAPAPATSPAPQPSPRVSSPTGVEVGPSTPEPDPGQAVRFLVVCTANRCRSPMAEVLLRARLREIASPTLVSSAGTLADDGAPAMPEAVSVAAGLAEHSSRPLTPGMIDEADLVICMTREHVRTVVTLVPEAFARTFTLKDFVNRAAAAGPRRPGEAIESWLAWVSRGRRLSDLVGYRDADDLEDPIGLPAQAYRRCATEIDALLAPLVSLVFPAE